MLSTAAQSTRSADKRVRTSTQLYQAEEKLRGERAGKKMKIKATGVEAIVGMMELQCGQVSYVYRDRDGELGDATESEFRAGERNLALISNFRRQLTHDQTRQDPTDIDKIVAHERIAHGRFLYLVSFVGYPQAMWNQVKKVEDLSLYHRQLLEEYHADNHLGPVPADSEDLHPRNPAPRPVVAKPIYLQKPEEGKVRGTISEFFGFKVEKNLVWWFFRDLQGQEKVTTEVQISNKKGPSIKLLNKFRGYLHGADHSLEKKDVALILSSRKPCEGSEVFLVKLVGCDHPIFNKEMREKELKRDHRDAWNSYALQNGLEMIGGGEDGGDDYGEMEDPEIGHVPERDVDGVNQEDEMEPIEPFDQLMALPEIMRLVAVAYLAR